MFNQGQGPFESSGSSQSQVESLMNASHTSPQKCDLSLTGVKSYDSSPPPLTYGHPTTETVLIKMSACPLIVRYENVNI